MPGGALRPDVDREVELRHRDLLLTAGACCALLALVLVTRFVPPPQRGAPDAAVEVRIAARPTAPEGNAAAGGVATPDTRSTSNAAHIPPNLPQDADLLLVQPRSGTPEALAAALRQRGYAVVETSSLLDVVRVRVPAGTSADVFAGRLAATSLLASVEADTRVRAGRLPDDPLLGNQRPYLDVIRAPQAWDRVTSAARIVIAVVDSGISAAHPELASRMAVNPAEREDGLDEDGNGCIDDRFGCTFVSPAAADPSCGYTLPAPRGGAAEDDEGHGTFVAGIAAAAGNNAAGIAGVAWDARLLPVKVLDCTATGRISDAAAGIRYAARAGAHVIIVAFGSGSDSRVLRDAVAEATARGALIVASVGNDGGSRVQFPAAYPGVLAVGGTGTIAPDGSVDYRQPAAFSNRGPEVALYAPAVRLVAPLPPALCGQRGWVCLDTERGYARATGTSFAAPLVAGAAALVLAQEPELGPTLTAAALRASARPLATGLRQPGLLDLLGALDYQFFSMGAGATSRGPFGPPAQGAAADPLHP